MGRIKIIPFVSKKLKDGSYPLLIRISADNERKYIGTGLRIMPAHWNDEEELPNDDYKPADYEKHARMNKSRLISELAEIKKRINTVNTKFELDEVDWTVGQWCDTYKRKKVKRKMTVLKYFDIRINELKNNKPGTAQAYKTSKQRLSDFLKDKVKRDDIGFNELTRDLLKKFRAYYENRKTVKGSVHTPGAISVYMRTIRALYNHAIPEYASEENYPFRKSSKEKSLIPNGRPSKRALTKEQMIRFKEVHLEERALQQAREYFMFSFYCRGMNWADMVELKLNQIKGGIITYTRKKTENATEPTEFKIKIKPQIQEIIDRYSAGKLPNEYLFPVLKKEHTTPAGRFNRAKKVRTQVNKNLRIIARLAGIDEEITFYTARHSYATIMKFEGVSTFQIQDLLGHKDALTTETYLKSFGNEVLDDIDEQTIDF